MEAAIDIYPTESFPHEGEHLANDAKQARFTLLLLGAFAILSALALIIGLRAM